MAGTASRNRGPETSPAPAPAAPGGGIRRTPKKQRSRHNTNKTTHSRVPSGRQVPHVLREEGGNRRTPKKRRSRHNTNKTTHLRVPSGRQVPHVLQEEGAEDGVRLLRSPAPAIDPGGALVIHAEREQGFGGGGTGFLAGHQALACGAALLSRGEGPERGGAPEGTRASSPRHGGLCRGHRSRWKGPHLWRRPGFLFS